MNIKRSVRAIINQIEGTVRLELEDTPARVQRAYAEMFDGYKIDIPALFNTFEQDGSDQIVALKDILSWSVCEHHMLPFRCCVHVAYLPTTRVIGASKLERLVHAYCHRLQIQERIGKQIADTLMQYLEPRGVAVIIHAEHLCMRCRGVKSTSSQLVNSVMLGVFRESPISRMEVLSLLGQK